MDYTEKTVERKEIFNGRVIHVVVDTVELPDGSLASREMAFHPGGVGVIAVTEDRKVYMVRQFRKPYEAEILEVPAGKLEPGEDPLECGIRELEEETGLRAEKMTYLGASYVSPGFCSETIHLYLATGLSEVGQHLDDGEFLDVLTYDLDELYQMALNNEIMDAKTLIAILKAKGILGEQSSFAATAL